MGLKIFFASEWNAPRGEFDALKNTFPIQVKSIFPDQQVEEESYWYSLASVVNPRKGCFLVAACEAGVSFGPAQAFLKCGGVEVGDRTIEHTHHRVIEQRLVALLLLLLVIPPEGGSSPR
jgi:hypothetical protein